VRITCSRPQISPLKCAGMRVMHSVWHTNADNVEMQSRRVNIYQWEPCVVYHMPDIRGQWRDRGSIVLVAGETLREWYARHVEYASSERNTPYFPGGITPREIDQLYAFKVSL